MKLFWKIFSSVFSSFIILIFITSYFISIWNISEREKCILENYKAVAGLISKELEIGYAKSEWPFESLKTLSGRKDLNFWWVVRDDGVIHLADNASFMGTSAYSYFPPIINIKGDEEVILNRKQNYGIFIKKFEAGKKEWVFLLSFSLRDIVEMKKKIIFMDTTVLILASLLLGIVLYVMIKFFTKPIKELAIGTQAIGKGDLTYKVKVKSQDELGQLANSFNQMIKDLQKITVSRDELAKEIEERKKAEEALQAQKYCLEDINKELDDFTYIISHDLKEPLRSIDAFSKFITDDYKDKLDEQGRFYIERVRMNTSRMQKLIEDLLEISRIERKKNILEELEAEELIEEVKLRMEVRIKEKNVQITIRDKLPRVYCDRVRLTEVFANLISNAIKFNDKPMPLIEIGSSEKEGFYEFYVKDNGPGIEEQYFDKIFEIFQRLGKREDNEGTGAGLTIVKKIVQMHKGKIWLESKIGEGTKFYFTIPTREKMSSLCKKKIGEILVEKKLITEEEIKKALEEQEGAGI